MWPTAGNFVFIDEGNTKMRFYGHSALATARLTHHVETSELRTM